MKSNLLRQTILIILSLILLASCSNPAPVPTPTAETPPEMTLTIIEDQCTFDGPDQIPFGAFRIKLNITEQKPVDEGYALVTLAQGKTIDDLKAWPSAAQPGWVTLIDGVHEPNAGNHTYAYDLNRITTAYQGGPLYLVCFRTLTTLERMKIGAFGPIMVIK